MAFQRIMSLVLLPVFGVTLSACGPGTDSGKTPNFSDPSIFGGQRVAEDEWQAVVGLTYRQGAEDRFVLECVGTLVHPKVVVTAGHCLKDSSFDLDRVGSELSARLRVYVGSGEEGGKVRGQYRVVRAGYHPLLRSHPLGYADFGYLVLEEPIEDLEPLPIASTIIDYEGQLATSDQFTLVGYGRRDDSGKGLKFQVKTTTRSWNSQEAIMGGSGKDACSGDSGGPVFALGPDGRPVLFGIISRGIRVGCGAGGYVGLLPSALCWLEDQTGLTFEKSPSPHAPCGARAASYPDDLLPTLDFTSLCKMSRRTGARGEITSTQIETIAAIMGRLSAQTCEDAGHILASQREVDLSDLLLRDLTPLANLVNIRRLDLSGNRIKDPSPLKTLSKLRSLDLTGNDIENFSPLASLEEGGLRVFGKGAQTGNFTQTRFLEICQNEDSSEAQRKTIRAIFWTTQTDDCELANKRLLGLKTLHLIDQDLTDMTPLAGLPHLRGLDLSGNPVYDVAPLASCEGLRHLDLSGTVVDDVSSLSQLIAEGLEIVGVEYVADGSSS